MKDGEHIQKLFNDMKQVTTYKDGKKNGKETYWYPIGQKASECYYVNDKLEGELTAWTEFGLVIQQDNYKSNLLHGLSRVWNEDLNNPPPHIKRNLDLVAPCTLVSCYGLILQSQL